MHKNEEPIIEWKFQYAKRYIQNANKKTLTGEHALCFVNCTLLVSFIRENRFQIPTSPFSILIPVWITSSKASLCVVSTSCLIPVATVFQPIAIFSRSTALLGPWWCLGATRIVPSPRLEKPHSSITRPWTRTLKTGSCTALVCQEWNHCRVTPLTGGQHAVTQRTVWIFETTSVETSQILMSWITLEVANARRWNSLTSAGILEYTSQQVFGKKLVTGSPTSTALLLNVPLIHPQELYQAKTTLVSIKSSTHCSVAPRMTSLLLSGGLEVICKAHVNCSQDSKFHKVVLAEEIHKKWLRLI